MPLTPKSHGERAQRAEPTTRCRIGVRRQPNDRCRDDLDLSLGFASIQVRFRLVGRQTVHRLIASHSGEVDGIRAVQTTSFDFGGEAVEDAFVMASPSDSLAETKQHGAGVREADYQPSEVRAPLTQNGTGLARSSG